MSHDDEVSLDDQDTFKGGSHREAAAQSLGDQQTFSSGAKNTDPQSLGDDLTFGGAGLEGDAPFDDEMEVVNLAARYVTERTLGQGGMGEVLLAFDNRLERKVAIKRILGAAAQSQTAVNRFLTEAKSIAALNHPNIVQIYDYGRDYGGPFLIMEYVEGNSLLERCADGALPLEEAVELTCQLCDGLGKAHDTGIIHRDIKPANVLLTPDGIPKLMDFGLAKVETGDSGMTVTGAVLGTLDFMPPEQRKDAALTDSRSDLWSLGATLYQMVTGKSPKIIKFNDVPQALQDVLGKVLEDAGDDRYQTASAFRDALRDSLQVAEQPIEEIAVDLGFGECAVCHARNEASRKYCNGCGASLRVECLSCGVDIPLWDSFCGECGSNQVDLIAARRVEVETDIQKAESLRNQYEFNEALKIANEINEVVDIRLSLLQSWSEKFIIATQTEWDQQKTNATDCLTEAKAHRKVFDYQSAIHTIEKIPKNMRTQRVSQFLNQLQ